MHHQRMQTESGNYHLTPVKAGNSFLNISITEDVKTGGTLSTVGRGVADKTLRKAAWMIPQRIKNSYIPGSENLLRYISKAYQELIDVCLLFHGYSALFTGVMIQKQSK